MIFLWSLTHCGKLPALSFRTATVPPVAKTHAQIQTCHRWGIMSRPFFTGHPFYWLIHPPPQDKKSFFCRWSLTYLCLPSEDYLGDIRDWITATSSSLLTHWAFTSTAHSLGDSASGRDVQYGCPGRRVIICYDHQKRQRSTGQPLLFRARSDD